MKRSVDELTRLAFVYAEQDRRALADSYTPLEPEAIKALELAYAFAEYRRKRWGRTMLEELMSTLRPVSIAEIARRGDQARQRL